MEPTSEQKDIVDYAGNMDANEMLTIAAFAGTAKTTTLIFLAYAYPQRCFLYLVFNKAMAEEARTKFPSNVTIKTTHSLAYPYIVGKRKVKNNYRPAEIASLLGLQFDEARHVLSVFELYCNSAVDSIDKLQVDDKIAEATSKLYDMMCDGKIDVTHSWYLKEFQLQTLRGLKIKTSFDYVLLDESQDTNSVTLSIFNNLPGKKIRVGDEHQAIYGFRGAINGMNDRGDKKVKHTRKNLTTTFRCHQHIVNQANWVLHAFKGETNKIISGNNNEPVIKTLGVLSRTNSTLIEYMDELPGFNLTRSPDQLFECLLSVHAWKYGNTGTISKQFMFLTKFKNMSALTEYIELTDDQELRQAVKLLEKYDNPDWASKGFPRGSKINKLYEKAVDNYRVNGESYVTLSSAHSSKGLEYDKVYVTEDFPDFTSVIKKLIEGKHINHPEDFLKSRKQDVIAAREEINLYYVAITRAKYELVDKTANKELYEDDATLESVFYHALQMARKD